MFGTIFKINSFIVLFIIVFLQPRFVFAVPWFESNTSAICEITENTDGQSHEKLLQICVQTDYRSQLPGKRIEFHLMETIGKELNAQLEYQTDGECRGK